MSILERKERTKSMLRKNKEIKNSREMNKFF